MSSSLELAAVDKAFRSYLALHEDEIAHLVFIAAVLCNFDPHRSLPIWLVIVGAPSSGKSSITRTILGWPPVHQLPNPITPAYLLSSKNARESALYKIAEQGQRILYLNDMAQFAQMRYDKENRKVYPQLLDLHDGKFKRATGYTKDELIYDAEKHGLLGWIGSATHKFYRFQDEVQEWGSRFMVYPLRSKPEEWHTVDFLRRVEQKNSLDHIARELEAADRVRLFLDMQRRRIEAGEFDRVKIAKGYAEQIMHAVTLTQRALATGLDNDPGTRLYKRIVHLARMLAFMAGKNAVTQEEATIGCRIAVGQIPFDRREVLSFALINADVEEGWSMTDLCNFVGGIRQVYLEPVQRLVDVGLLADLGKRDHEGRRRRSASVPSRYRLTEHARQLIVAFDPAGVAFEMKR